MEKTLPKHFFLCILLLCFITKTFAQGSDCSNANVLTLDGSCNKYTVSPATGACVFCTTTGYNGTNGHITYFQFTTNSSSECVLIDISTETPVTMEMVLYDGCSAGIPLPAGGQYQHNMCLDNGSGLWSQNLFNNLQPNTTYYLAVRTAGGYEGNLLVCAKYYTPPNDECAGATPIDSIPLRDNNACHNPSYSVPAGQLCAITLENTAWYTFVVKEDGTSIITIDSIECNNGNGNSSNGFQIGFFIGDCNSLIPFSCSDGIGGTVLAPAANLTGGSRIYVGVDGYSGSNCRYTINATNAIILPVTFKNFVAWKAPGKNILKWTTAREINNKYFEIQRSEDGRHYSSLGIIESRGESQNERQYVFEDYAPLTRAFYRLKQVNNAGRFSYSRVIEVKRENIAGLKILPVPPVANMLRLGIESPETKIMSMNIIDITGKVLLTDRFQCNKGVTWFEKEITRFTPGKYTVILKDDQDMVSQSFIKTGVR